MADILPAILVKTKDELEEKINAIEPYVSRAHLDIADGIFVPNKTIDGFLELAPLETGLSFQVHLMVTKPENHIAKWLDCNEVESIIFHTEATQKHVEVVNAIREGERSVGIGLNPQTPHSAIHEWIDLVDYVHFLAVEPGFYGSPFVESVVEKIKDFHFYYPDKPISVDGHVDPSNFKELLEAGVSDFTVGTYLYKTGVEKGLNTLKNV